MISKYPFKNLVFQGGGVKAFAYHGALRVLEQKNALQNIERVAGTSAGAVLATLLSFRLNAEETIALFKTVDYSKVSLKSDKELELGNRNAGTLERELWKARAELQVLSRLIRRFGLYANNYARDWMQQVISEQCAGDGRATFADFRQRGYRDLHIIAANLTRHKLADFSFATTPDMPVADAVVMSGSLPLYFEAPQHDGRGFGAGDFFADGGMVSNFPMHVFDAPSYAENNRRFMYGVNWETLGCRLYTPEGCALHERPIGNVFGYLANLFETIAETQIIHFENSLVDRLRTVNISNCGVDTTDFHIKPDENDPTYRALVTAGETATRAYLAEYRLPTDRLYDVKAKFADFLSQVNIPEWNPSLPEGIANLMNWFRDESD